jgi:hypothetical protein
MWSLLQVIEAGRKVRPGAVQIRVTRFGSAFAGALGIATICIAWQVMWPTPLDAFSAILRLIIVIAL